MDGKSRVSKILRDARATVSDPVRPVTPADMLGSLASRGSTRPHRRLSELAPLNRVNSGLTPLTREVSLLKVASSIATKSTAAEKLSALDEFAQLAEKNPAAPDFGQAMSSLLPCIDDKEPEVASRAAGCIVRFSVDEQMLGLAADRLHGQAKKNSISGIDGPCLDAILRICREGVFGTPCLVSSTAILRYSSQDSDIQKQLITLGVLPAIIEFSTKCMERIDDDAMITAFVNLAVLVRNLSVDYSHHVSKLSVINALYPVFPPFMDEREVATAYARLLAKLVFEEECLAQLANLPQIRETVLTCILQHKDNKLVVSRLSLVAAILFENDAGAVNSATLSETSAALVDLLKAWSSSSETSTNILRLMCALTVDPAVGKLLAEQHHVEGIIELLSTLDASDEDQLVMGLMCISNISFFFSESSGVAETIAALGPLLAAVTFGPSIEALVEATRALGNITTFDAGRDWMGSSKMDSACVALLDHSDDRVQYNCLGVLLNLTAQPSSIVDEALLERAKELTSSDNAEIQVVAEHLRHNIEARMQ